jgi:hypothetical protein
LITIVLSPGQLRTIRDAVRVRCDQVLAAGQSPVR